MGCQSSKPKVDTSQPTVKITNTNKDGGVKKCQNSDQIDAYARKAPKSLKNSVEDLVNYMYAFSKDPTILARGFFVWISENIKYDVDGFFGRSTMAPCDALGVMKAGRSVCEGYASVMETLCNQANIPVKKLSGYSKGYGHSADKPISLSHRTDHAWNAIQLEEKWYLLDCTWGAGHLDTTNAFKKEFQDFYFMTDPKKFITDHFPYMDDNLEESKKWQLLDKPISLDEFNSNVQYKPEAFKLGIQAVSHTKGYIEMQNELQMIFKSTKKDDFVLSGCLMLLEGNYYREQQFTTFGNPDKGNFKLLVRPPKAGLYELSVFGQLADDERLESIPEVIKYSIKCTAASEQGFEYPMSYITTGNERTILLEPLVGKLRANTSVKFTISAPSLKNIMAGDTYLEKDGHTFSGLVKTGTAGTQLGVFGTHGDRFSRMKGLYAFKVC